MKFSDKEREQLIDAEIEKRLARMDFLVNELKQQVVAEPAQ